MNYAIIGFGQIGQALAKALARNGIEVSVATTRAPQSFASEAAAIGPTIVPKTLADAVKRTWSSWRCVSSRTRTSPRRFPTGRVRPSLT